MKVKSYFYCNYCEKYILVDLESMLYDCTYCGSKQVSRVRRSNGSGDIGIKFGNESEYVSYDLALSFKRYHEV